ncbi:RING-H2 finger protein ATL29-like [Oryza brachyantha]|uniref:RING-H2 finger protein ATL29-like n=1 Tax=Oryza brachyantha TaxID=4533 RepID=UPI001ADBCF14|nr:RING-H2 finger protein ATL29-like [Oryza brachyantha]
MAARHLLLLNAHAITTHDPAANASRSPPPPDQRQSFPTLLPVFILFVLLLCFLSIFLIRDLLHFLSLWLRRRRRRPGFHDGDDDDDDDVAQGSPPAPPRKPPGLDPAILASFPTVRFDQASAAVVPPECVVCLSDFTGGDDVRLLTACRHAFHTACIDSWLRAHTTCPVCRSDLDAPVHGEPAIAVDVECDQRGGAG